VNEASFVSVGDNIDNKTAEGCKVSANKNK